ncbi:MAG: ATP-grasp domain-containing protein, partial [Cyclobacteriaceae bacterium]|nr:ATP-grasp domain-containing protein [Cyclobacteriaceae bacterium]
MKKIKKILIANRGEIAVRIIQSAKELGIKTVSVYSDIDRAGLHTIKADEVVALKSNGMEPYLDIEQIIDAATKTKADAIHPGYGFLSENDIFARRVVESGFIFIGPSHEAIKMMGDKLRAKETAIKAGVPVIPGFELTDENDLALTQKINSIGFPVLIKARAGGGGKGMRIVHSSDQLQEQIGQSIREAKEAFGDGSVFVEKLIKRPRHIEIQILADQHGNAVHLFERECSIQRRHQKV